MFSKKQRKASRFENDIAKPLAKNRARYGLKKMDRILFQNANKALNFLRRPIKPHAVVPKASTVDRIMKYDESKAMKRPVMSKLMGLFSKRG